MRYILPPFRPVAPFGQSDPNRFIIVGGHIDSRVNDVMNTTSDAPGANDHACGVALVMEAAHILSKEKFAASIVYVAFSGEEQGLLGATLLAQTPPRRQASRSPAHWAATRSSNGRPSPAPPPTASAGAAPTAPTPAT